MRNFSQFKGGLAARRRHRYKRHIIFVTLSKIVNISALYTVGHKKQDTFIFWITQTNIDRFS